jgi:hypothetical protein
VLLGLGFVGAALAGCGREALFLETSATGGGGSGGGTTGGGGTGGFTCSPSPEVCDGKDNNCDGQVDEGCSCTDGATQNCYAGPNDTLNVGACKGGTQACSGGQWGLCTGQVLPKPEACDGVDDDCNGKIDDGLGGDPCTLGLSGVCAMGAKKCIGGSYVCSQVNFPTAEACDGLDNNCNGQIDEGNPGGGGACMTGQPGACAVGVTNCQQGLLKCVANIAQTEVCDGIDNDCNGVVDDVPNAGSACVVMGQPPPCNQGTLQCQGQMLVCVPSGNGGPEVCDGKDNNCNGQIDEGNPGGGGACMTGLPGVCGPGTLTCQAGMLACIANAAQGPELCNQPGDENCNGASATVFFQETFANNSAGWTMDQEWQILPAKASAGQNYGNPDPATDHTATADNGVAGVVIGGNAQPMPQHPPRWLTSPIINVDPAAPKVYLEFWRFLNSDYTPWMTNRVDVFDATTNSWASVWVSGGAPGEQDAAWTKEVYDITAHAKGGTVRVRFGFDVGANGAFTVSQWNVDDVVVTTEPCDL